MVRSLLWLALIGLLLPASARPIVGATRWDAWEAGNEGERNLAPKQWHARLPFYSHIAQDGQVTVRGDTQEVMDREIAYAHNAGLGRL